MSRHTTETNQIVRAWIWFWYSIPTRMIFVLCGLHLVLFVPLFVQMGLTGESLKNATIAAYFTIFLWAMVDNDFTNLERIGLNVDRKPLLHK